MLHFIVRNNQLNELKEAYLETICGRSHLEEDALKLILKCDNLDFEERETLHEQIKFIRFYQIDHKEFIPAYKHLLPDNLDVDILHCHLDPDARPL
ncbi:12813_t:CDS:2 [Gigaspora rosea]|nr:12813_t:CDS:2 [Gigaspora rosea]